MKYKVTVFLKENVFDPQGNSILRVLHNLGYNDVTNLRVGKVFFIETNGNSKEIIDKIAYEILSNPVIEKYTIEELND
jgi:phosphoribosylformylglycinamidine synthase PurS subunit